MSNTSEFSEAESGINTADESSFSKTCNRLREYLKEKGSLGDVTLGISLAPDHGLGISPAGAKKSEALPRSISSMNLFPRDSAKAEDVSKVAMEPKNSQMTIFYGGQVMVFNGMHASKAMEVMRLASTASSQVSNTSTPAASGLGVTATERVRKISPPVLGEIPIARKQSLARFLEKRKERIMAHSPYFSNSSTKGVISSAMPADKSWLGLAGL